MDGCALDSDVHKNEFLEITLATEVKSCYAVQNISHFGDDVTQTF